MVSFESDIFAAQSHDNIIGSVTASSLTGGPLVVSKQLGGVASADGVSVFTNDAALATAKSTTVQASVYRGQQLFNNLTFIVTNDEGINNIPGVPNGIPLT